MSRSNDAVGRSVGRRLLVVDSDGSVITVGCFSSRSLCTVLYC